MLRVLPVVAAAFCLFAASQASAQAPAAPEPSVYGVWKNPKGSVHLNIQPCGPQVCGVVVWASPGADADARKGSGKPITGQQLLRDFRPDRGGFRGKVYAPDLDRTFSGTAKLLDADRLEAKGCVLGGLICKTQVWRRVKS